MDMSLSQEEEASRSLVYLRHIRGHLLDYFLAPGTSNLCFDEVLTHMIDENYMELQRIKKNMTSSLQKHNSRRIRYLNELDELSKKLDSTGSDRMRGELEARRSVINTALPKLKASINQWENLLEECWLREHEAQQAALAEADIIVESSTEEASSDASSSSSPGNSPHAQLQKQADAESTQAGASEGNPVISPEEEKILMGDQTSTPGKSPASDTSLMTGSMATLQLRTPPCEGTEGDEISK